MHVEQASGTAGTLAQDPPLEIRVAKTRDVMRVLWKNGDTSRLSARLVRANCQSAGAKRLRLAELDVPPPADIRIEDVQPVGSYAVNILFSDGHQRGIYPWRLLRELAEINPEADEHRHGYSPMQ